MIQYRHKKFGTIVFKAKEGDIHYFIGKSNPQACIPAGMVEKSDEWVQLGKPLFVTDDGVQMFEGDYWWYVTMCANPHVARTNAMTYGGKPENVKPIRRYSNEFAARDFAKTILNSPMLTLVELELMASELKISKTTLNLIKNKFSKK